LAPEILELQGKGGNGPEYGYSIDFWCLGNFIMELLTGHPPFQDDNPREMRRRILHDNVKMPPAASPHLTNLVAGLLQRSPLSRFTADKVRSHQFWTATWEDVLEKRIEPPIKPRADDQDEAINFDSMEDTPPQTPRSEAVVSLPDNAYEEDLSKMFKSFAKDLGWSSSAGHEDGAVVGNFTYVWGEGETESSRDASSKGGE
jgi:serine/threonine protein kinase